MFFPLSKILGFFAIPSNLVISIGVLGLLLLLTRFARAGRVLAFASLIVLAILGLSPAGNALIIPLEERFPRWDATRGAPDGIIVLGGAISPDVSAARDDVALNEAAERLTVAAELARRYPAARILFSGGSGALIYDVRAAFARRPRHPARAHHVGRPLPQHGRERRFFQGPRPPQTRRALAAGDISPSSAAGDRRFPQSGLSGRSLPGGLADAGNQ